MKNLSQTALFVIDSFHIGGAYAFMKQHAEAVQKAGYKVVIIGGKGNLHNPVQQIPGVTLIELGVSEGYGSLYGRLLWFVSTVKSIHRIYNTYNISLCYSPLPFSFLALLTHYRTWKISRIYAFCGNVSMELKSARIFSVTLMFKIKMNIFTILQKIAVSSATHILTFSVYAKQLVIETLQCDESKITIIPGYIKDIRLNKKFSKDPVRLLSISRFEPRKGLDTLLYVGSLLQKSGVNFSLTIAGSYDPIYLNRLFEIYERLNLFTKIQFIHSVSEEQMNILFDSADIVIVPSKDLETFGLLTIQALAYGVPVIATPAGANKEILMPMSKYLLSESTSQNEIKIAIQKFISLSQKEKNHIHKKIYKRLMMQYSKNRVIRVLTDYFKHVA